MLPATDPPLHSSRNGPTGHVLASHFCTAVRLLLALSLIATFVGLFRFPHAVYLAALPIPILCVVLMLAHQFAEGSRALDLPAAKGCGTRHELRQADIIIVHGQMREFRPRRRWASESVTARPGRELSFPLLVGGKDRCKGFEGGVLLKL